MSRSIIDGARKAAYTAINISLVQRNWLLGKRIAEESLQGNDRAVYGLETIKNLSRQLTAEFGKGFTSTDLYWYVRFYNAFPEIFEHIHTEKEDYFIDLVFYNYILKCFCLFDLKTTKVSHQDVGQMDMYVRMYDELKRNEGDNPTMGIILCSDTDEDIARYSILHGNEQLFASKYKLYLPSEEELKREIETQKQLFYLQQEEAKIIEKSSLK